MQLKEESLKSAQENKKESSPKKKAGRIGKAIAHAALALTCVTANAAQKIEDAPNGYFSKKANALQNWADWSGEIGFLGYSESDGRIQALEPAISLNAEFEGEKIWSFKLVFDSLTGSSPNGALISDQPQTFTSPSGKASYTVGAGETPLFDQFRDTRVNASSTWSQPLSRLLKGSAGFNLSKEFDYLSAGLNTSFTKETESKNTSFSFGLSYTLDQISPVGNTPLPLAGMLAPGATQPKTTGSETKKTLDILLGFSQIMSRSWIVQGNLSLGLSNGYMNDPYKFVTVHDDTPGATLGDPTGYVYESRPDSRSKQSLFLGSKNHTGVGVLALSYRYYTDDWGLDSHTVETSLNFAINNKWRLQPGIRYYSQTAVDFFTPSVGASAALPKNATADYRLCEMTAFTPSLKIIKKLKDEKEISLYLQYYMQTVKGYPSSSIGSQMSQDLYPDLNAFILHIIYSF